MSLDPTDLRTIDDVANYGWHCLHVAAEGDLPGFSFSVGFWETLNAPEVIIFGLRHELTHEILWEVFRQIQAGKTLVDGERWTGLIEGFDCISRPVHPSQIDEHFGVAIWYRRYRTGLDDLRAFQMFWPGKLQGLFPWEAGCDEDVRAAQALLYRARQ